MVETSDDDDVSGAGNDRRASGKPRYTRKLIGPRGRRAMRGIGWLLTLPERRPLTFFAIALLTIFAFDALDSFGLDDVGERAWGEVTESIMAPLYGGSHRIGQDAIVVVLIDEASMDSLSQDGLPISYENQAEILSTVAAAGPRAIFLDAYYPRARLADDAAMRFRQFGSPPPSGVAALARTVEAIGRKIPLFVGPIGVAPSLKPLADTVSAPGTPSSSGVHQVSITVDPREVRAYPMASDTEHGRDGRPMPSAALSLYRAYCARTPSAPSRTACAEHVPSSNGQPMLVRWGLGVSAWRSDMLPVEMRDRCGSDSGGPARFVRFALRGLFRSAQKDARDDRLVGEQCGYSDIVDFRNLNDRDGAGMPIAAHLKDKMVLIGVDLPTSSDRRVVPLYGDVPGVMAHAMALDNLIQNRGRALQVPAKIGWGIDELDLIQYAGIIVVLALYVALTPRLRHMVVARDTLAMRSNLIGGISALLLLTIWAAIASYAYSRNWPLSAVVFGGFLPGGMFGIGLILLSRAGQKGGGADGS